VSALRDTQQWSRHTATQRFLLSQLAEEPVATLLDLGSGVGSLGLAFHEQHPRTFVIDLDMSMDALHEAAAGLRATGGPGMVICADARAIPLRHHSVDLITAVSVLHWLAPGENDALAECARVLRPSGRVVVMNMVRRAGTRQFTLIVDELILAAAAQAGVDPVRVPRLSARHHTLPVLRRALISAGLRVERATEELRRSVTHPDGATFLAFLERTMRGFYWSSLGVVEAQALKGAVVEGVDAIVARRGSFNVPVLIAVVVARRPGDRDDGLLDAGALLACPVDHGAMVPADEGLRCRMCDRWFPIRDGIPQLQWTRSDARP
jgi:ubiquinone/menaquinone biosynthesis C-methylase UbiE/uncharacterized protein YbaR (Trm112 family)